MYAIQQYDAFGKIPSPGFFEIELIFDGNYQECRRISGVKYDTNYCYVVLIPGRNADCSGGNINNIGNQVAFRRAVCMPKSCGSGDTVNLYNQLSGLPLTACATFCSERDVPKDSSFWGFSIFMTVIISIAILATSVDYLRESIPFSVSSTHVLSGPTHLLSSTCLLNQTLISNASTVLEDCPWHGYFLLMYLIIFCFLVISFQISLKQGIISDTLMPIKSFASYFADSFFINANFSVDTFFLVSGITVAYSFFRMKPTSKILRSPSTWILFYVHRFIRLTPPYMIFIGFYTVYSLYIQGPLAASLFNFTVLQVEACKASWWRNLIYINNFDDGENPCYGPSWYLAVDTQLYLIAPILLIGLSWKPIFGIVLSIIGCAGSILTVYILYLKFDLPADSFHSDASGKFNFYIYQKPWIRCPPYLIGILVGYYLAKNPGTSKLQLYRKVFFMGISFVLPFCFLIANKGYDEGKHQSYVKASYYNFSRFFWATSVGYIIVACHRGWAGPIGNFMNHPIWQPLGRLSYSAYIVHLMIVYYFLNVGAKPLHFVSTWQVYVYYILPATILTFTFAFFWSCLFELPIMKLEKYLLEVLRIKKIRSEPAPAEVPAWKEHHIHI
ncbi:Protein CBG11444 [Caenorhabditis briggsae]|uniref:Protein CBG11444 n=1 Tax=Caenorhabditis briggsae TaxID=6238 RepID=A8XD02_CAEBR|nr:Protein CBG11444 [Caenorhabditis briggsae]CAP30520.2 Protein CBG11444 [Caenorhabditis briggsae]